MQLKKSPKPKGRPRSFDQDEALDRALRVFWQESYEGASLSDLTKAMGINRPSLYAAFGDKEALFHKVLERYAEGPAAYVHDALSAPTARAVAEQLLRGAANLMGNTRNPRGCLMVQGALACGKEAASVRQELIARRTADESAIRRRLKRAKAEGDLPKDSNPAALARYVAAVVQGMAVQAAGGANREALLQVGDTALQGWPTSAKSR